MAVSELEAPIAAPEPRDPGRSGRPWWERLDLWAGLLVVAACCAFVFVELEPSLIFRNTTPSGGDTAAHVWWPDYLRDHLLPWRLAGMGAVFYGGLPGRAVLLPGAGAHDHRARRRCCPYNVAFKLVTVVGTGAPPARRLRVRTRVCARRARRRPRSRCGATAFLFLNGDPTNEADRVQPPHHGRQPREHPGRGVLVHDRAGVRARVLRHAGRVAAHRAPAVAPGGAPRRSS